MPTCPNCGSYIPLGNHSCSCGTTIRYDGPDYSKENSDYSEIRRETNPYDIGFFNELFHKGVSTYILDEMYDGLKGLEEKYNASLADAYVYGNAAFFKLLVEEEYFDATLRTRHSIDNAFEKMKINEDIITPDFTRLYQSQEIKKMLREMEIKTSEKFHFCKLLLIDGELMVSAIFDKRGYIIDFDRMCLIE